MSTPQDAHKKLVLQVYLDSNTLEFSDVLVKALLVGKFHCYLATIPEVVF